MENSAISWTTHTFNPWRGCTKVSEGCRHCYAESFSGRNPKALGVWGPSGTRVVAAEASWREPLKWNRTAALAESLAAEAARNPPKGYTLLPYQRPRVFCASLADVFEAWDGPMTASNGNPLWWCHGSLSNSPIPSVGLETGCRLATMGDIRARLFRLIFETPHLDWLLLTKRPEHMTRCIADVMNIAWGVPQKDSPFAQWTEDWLTNYAVPKNVWLGASVENQAAADERIPHLLATPATVRFLSMEPLLGPVHLVESFPDDATRNWLTGQFHGLKVTGLDGHPDFTAETNDPTLPRIDWVIVGGESGPDARPMHTEWARSLRDQCVAAGVAFHFKQWGEFLHTHPAELHLSPGPLLQLGNVMLQRVGKKDAGRLLDGRTWDELPTVKGGA